MPDIPLDQKFHTVADEVVTINRGSAVANSNRTIFTMADIISTVGAGAGGITGSGTATKIPVFSASTVVGDSPFTISGNFLQLPSLIRLIGNTNSSYGFSAADSFVVNTTGGQQIGVTANGLLAKKVNVITAVVPDGVSTGSLNVSFGTAPTLISYGIVGDIIIDASAIYVCTVTGADPTPATWLKATLGAI